jgi:hypothetical protein
MTINILDEEIVKFYDSNLKKQVDGIDLMVFNADEEKLYGGIVWPNEQYEYDAEKGGEYKICIMMTDSMFIKGFTQIKT